MSTAAEILQCLPRITKEGLDSQVSDEHIAELARQMRGWEVYMPDLLREDAEVAEEEIKHDYKSNYGLQKLEALRRWKRKSGSSATYRRLIAVFCKVQQADLAEKVKQLLVVSSSNTESAFSTGILAEYREHLVSCYTESPHPSCLGWPQAVAETYIDLPLTEAPPQPNGPEEGPRKKVVLGELFKTGKSDCERKRILIEGPAGCGKTTLTWHACRKWAAGRLFPEVNLLICLSLEDPSLHSAKSLADLIPHENSEMREAVANKIARLSGKGVCFLVDAWDEAPSSVQRKGSYVYRFISGSSLPHCSIVITSRPIAAGSLYPLLTARVVVGGFDRDRIVQFATATLGDGSAAKKELDKAFQINPRLLGLCNLPINTVIVLYLLQLQTPCSKLPSTRTELFYALVLNLLLRHMQLRTNHGLVEINEFEDMPESVLKTYKSVCGLAFHGVIKSKTQFVLRDLKALTIAPSLDTLGLLQAPRQLTEHGPQHRYSFLHYAVQEFLAAYHISKLTSEEQSKVVHQILHSNPLSSVLPFYAGLTRLTNSHVCSILIEVTKNPLDLVSLTERIAQNPGSESSDSRKLLLALTNCIYESQNKDVCELVSFQNPKCLVHISLIGLGLDAMDCMSFGYFFANKQLDKICVVELCNCHIGDIGIEMFMKVLGQGSRPKPKAMGIKLVLNSNDCSHLGVKYISETMSHAPILWGLGFVGWTRHGFDATSSLKYLTEGMCRRSARLMHISLLQCVNYEHTYNLILLISFGNLQELDLSNNDIGKSSVMSLLAQSLRYNRTLSSLEMDDCNISDDGLQHLGNVLQDHKTIIHLSIANNLFSAEALTSFLRKLCTPHSRLEKLRLESQWCKPEHKLIIKELNTFRQRDIPPLMVSSLGKSHTVYSKLKYVQPEHMDSDLVQKYMFYEITPVFTKCPLSS